ncbi:MAG: hypothetical protein HOC71_16640 [Candidatus Latescibacteria bacterium]|jgi:hypothetical protein|nr:hypothetical protein [Candidatus Latescibacterota bacterium]
MTGQNNEQISRKFGIDDLLIWVLGNTFGLNVGFLLGFMSHNIINTIITLDERIALDRGIDLSVYAICIGTSVGLTQWLLLRFKVTQLSLSALWILVSTIGILVGFWVGKYLGLILGLDTNFSDIYYVILVFTVSGFLCGILQWPLLQKHMARTQWWVLSSTIGWGLSSITFGISLGVVTGGTWMWLLRKEVQHEID